MARVRAEFAPPQPTQSRQWHPAPAYAPQPEPRTEPRETAPFMPEPLFRRFPEMRETRREDSWARKPHFKLERVGFFDPYAEGKAEIVMQGQNRIYRSVHLFLQSARDQARIVED